jgi:hypothetical protein
VTLLVIGALSGCGGSGGRPFTSSVGSNPNNPPTSPATFTTPTALAGAGTIYVINASHNGHIVGSTINESPTAMYFDSPTSTPVPIAMGSDPGSTVIGVNAAGQMVGYSSARVPLYWASATTAPTPLSFPSDLGEAFASGINDNGEIVGFASSGPDAVPLYWSSSSAAYQELSGVGGGSNVGDAGVKIANNGTIYGVTAANLGAMFWSSHSANGQLLALPPQHYYNGSSGANISINVVTGDAGGGAGGLTILPIMWSGNGQTLTTLRMPAGDTDATGVIAIGPNHQCAGISGTSPSIATYWATPTSMMQDLNTLIPQNTGWRLMDAAYILDNGDILGQGVTPSNQNAWYVVHPNP